MEGDNAFLKLMKNVARNQEKTNNLLNELLLKLPNQSQPRNKPNKTPQQVYKDEVIIEISSHEFRGQANGGLYFYCLFQSGILGYLHCSDAFKRNTYLVKQYFLLAPKSSQRAMLRQMPDLTKESTDPSEESVALV